MEFLHKEKAMVKKYKAPKMKTAVNFLWRVCVRPMAAKSFITAVHNGCGKPCGECGKLLVIHRHFGCLEKTPACGEKKMIPCKKLRKPEKARTVYGVHEA